MHDKKVYTLEENVTSIFFTLKRSVEELSKEIEEIKDVLNRIAIGIEKLGQTTQVPF